MFLKSFTHNIIMITAKDMRQTRDLSIARLRVEGVAPSTIAAAFGLTVKRVTDISRKPELVEGIMRTMGHREKTEQTKRFSAAEAEVAFENLSLRARNRLRCFHVDSIAAFRQWWKSGDEDSRRQHRELICGKGRTLWQDGKPVLPDVLLQTGEELVRLARGLGLRRVPPL